MILRLYADKLQKFMKNIQISVCLCLYVCMCLCVRAHGCVRVCVCDMSILKTKYVVPLFTDISGKEFEFSQQYGRTSFSRKITFLILIISLHLSDYFHLCVAE